jgi:hypothetical protein
VRSKNKSNFQKKFDKKSKQHTSYTLERITSLPQSPYNGKNESSVHNRGWDLQHSGQMLVVFYDLDEGLAIPTLCFHQEYKYVWIVRPWVLSARNDDKCMLWLISPE